MSSLSCIEWTLSAASLPLLERHCARCGCPKPFETSGKFRVNANGSRLDAWLIYRCIECGARWNRPVLERRSVHSVPSSVLFALQANDPVMARTCALAASPHADVSIRQAAAAFTLTRRAVPAKAGAPVGLTIWNPDKCRVRLDRVLAEGLNMSRATVLALLDSGSLRLTGEGCRAFRKIVRHGVRFEISPAAPVWQSDLYARLLGAP